MAIDDLSDQKMEISMIANISETAKDVVRRNTEEVQGRGNWALFDELFADNFFDHTPQPGGTRDKAGVLVLYKRLREAFPDFTPEIHWQRVDGDVVTTFKTYHGTHRGNFLGVAGTGTKVSFETVDAMRVVDGKITEHWGRSKPLLGHATGGRDRATTAGLRYRHVHCRPYAPHWTATISGSCRAIAAQGPTWRGC
jgi:predicted ester cyclase